MVRYQERQRSPTPAPWPDRPVEGASTADRTKYVAVWGHRPGVAPVHDDDRDPLTVLLLFERYDRRGALTRLYIRRDPIDSFRQGQERKRARAARAKFIRELCHRGLLKHPRKGCRANARGKYCPRTHGCKAG